MIIATRSDEERRRRNVRLAWGLAAFVLFVFISAIPFWQGLYRLAIGNG